MKKSILLIFYITLSNQLIGQTNYSLNGIISNCLQTYINTKYIISDNNRNNCVYICKDGLPLDYQYYTFSEASYISVDLLPYY